MLSWFFGHPEREAERGFIKFREVLNTLCTSQNFNKDIWFLTRQSRYLLRNELKIYLKDESIIERINKLSSRSNIFYDEKAGKSINIESLESALKSHAAALKHFMADIQDMLVNIGRRTVNCKEAVIKINMRLDEIAIIMRTLADSFDVLMHVHLGNKEIEFYTMKRRNQNLIFQNGDEMYISRKNNYLLLKEATSSAKILKFPIIFETSCNQYNSHLRRYCGHINVRWHKSQFIKRPGFINSVDDVIKLELETARYPNEYTWMRKPRNYKFLKIFTHQVGDQHNKPLFSICVFMEEIGNKMLIHGHPHTNCF